MNNPIIRRELLGMLRSPQTLAVQVVMVAALSLLVLMRWPSDATVGLTGEQAQQVLRVFGYGLLVALMLLSPVFPATGLVREKQQGTLLLLLTSPMSRWTILAGKLAGVLGFIGLMVLLSLPAAAACYAMGGVGLGQVLMMYAVLVAVAIQYASLGLLVSTYASTTDSALRITFGLVLAMSVASLGPHQFLQSLLFGPAGTFVDWVRCLSPIPAMLEVLGQTGLAERGTIGTGDLATRYLLLAVVTSAIFILATAKRLNQRMFDKPRAKGAITEDQSAGVRAYRRVMFLYDPNRRSKLIPRWMNPVLVKEFRTRKFGRTHWILRLFAVCLILSLGLMLAATRGTMDWGPELLGAIVVVLQMALLVLLTPSLASGLISAERETGGWHLLQSTPISPRRIVTGKLASVFWTLLLVLMATLPACFVLALISQEQAMRFVSLGISLGVTAIFCVLLSAAVSSIFSRTSTATAVAYGLLLTLCAGTLLFWMGGPGDDPDAAPLFTAAVVERVLLVNPVAAALALIQAPGFEKYQLVPGNWWFLGGASAVCLLVLSLRTWKLTRPQ